MKTNRIFSSSKHSIANGALEAVSHRKQSAEHTLRLDRRSAGLSERMKVSVAYRRIVCLLIRVVDWTPRGRRAASRCRRRHPRPHQPRPVSLVCVRWRRRQAGRRVSRAGWCRADCRARRPRPRAPGLLAALAGCRSATALLLRSEGCRALVPRVPCSRTSGCSRQEDRAVFDGVVWAAVCRRRAVRRLVVLLATMLVSMMAQ